MGRSLPFSLVLALGCGVAEGGGDQAVDRSPLELPSTVVSSSSDVGRFLDPAQILVARDDGYAVWSASGGTGPTWVGPSGLRDATTAAGTLWLATDEGLRVLRDDAFVASPVDEAMGGRAERLELSVDGLWIGSTAGLHWYRNERIIAPEQTILAAAGGALAYGLMPDATPGVWLLSGGQIHGVRADGDTLRLFSLEVSGAIDLAADGAGTLWWVDEDGTVNARGSDGLTWQVELAPVRRIMASPAASGAWVETDEGLHRVDFFSARPVDGLGFEARLLDVEGAQALIADGRGLVLVGEGAMVPDPDPDPRPDTPTWSADVQPLAAESCFLCHGAGASARDLTTLESWSSQWDDIQENVQSARMPLPPLEPLTPAALERLRAWADAGFPE